MYDSNVYSSPLSLLQLPATSLPEITSRLTQPGNSVARFSQDGKSLTDLRGLVPEADLQQATEVTVDVGFVCKKCHMVYPAEVLCLNHQRASCFSTKPIGEIKAMLKLVQSHVECRACRERFTTIMDFKFHCDMDRHMKRVQKIQRESLNGNNGSSNNNIISSCSNTGVNQTKVQPAQTSNSAVPISSSNHFAMVSSSTLTALSNSATTMSNTQQHHPTQQINNITSQTTALNNHGGIGRNGLPDVTHLFFSGMGMESMRLGMGLDPETPDPKNSSSVVCGVGAGDSVTIS